MPSVVDVFGVTALLAIFGYFLYIVYYTLDLFFLNPFARLPRLTEHEKATIAANLPLYRNLSVRKRKRFHKRVVRFRSRKKVIFHKEVTDRDHITLLLSATAVMLTLGMADFLILSIKKILVYPAAYYSPLTKQDHNGEYHPGLKTLVFSAEHLMEGFRIGNDNMNLAVHEFAHAISFNVANKLNVRSYIFLIGMRQIKRLLSDSNFNNRMDQSAYFRSYGRTNIHEFFAVSVENLMETPGAFRRQFPKLFGILRRMLNLKILSDKT
ncbi:zinc-dependent peptidase [Spongiimicrobium sp. 2-473A-2-J]|uniref:zinc-dependent peptidase n=1 Tax=Eudoraea algarum TaxID=3417568 RepID=UPI003D36F291